MDPKLEAELNLVGSQHGKERGGEGDEKEKRDRCAGCMCGGMEEYGCWTQAVRVFLAVPVEGKREVGTSVLGASQQPWSLHCWAPVPGLAHAFVLVMLLMYGVLGGEHDFYT